MNKKKIGLLSMVLKSLDTGHLEAIELCKNKCDTLIIGLVSDEECFKKNIYPFTNYETRKNILKSIYHDINILKMNGWLDKIILTNTKIDYFFRGNNYHEIPIPEYKFKLENLSKELNFEIIEFSQRKSQSLFTNSIYFKPNRIREMLENNTNIIALDFHDKLSASLISNAINSDGLVNALWGSSLTFSAANLRSDTEFFSLQERIVRYSEMTSEFQNVPIIIDGDTGGHNINLIKSIKLMNNFSMDAIVLEDKKGQKLNSLEENSSLHELSSIKEFKEKFEIIKETTKKDIVAIARLEGLIIGQNCSKIIEKSLAVIESGADVLMIHTKENNAKKVLQIHKELKKIKQDIKLMMVPQNITNINPKEWFKLGINILVYPNHTLRSVHKALITNISNVNLGKSTNQFSGSLSPINNLINIEKNLNYN